MLFLTWRVLKRRAFVAVLFAFAVSISIFPTVAADNPTSSALAGVAFPQPSWAWPENPKGNRTASVEWAAALARRSCTTTEFHAWRFGDPAAATALRDKTDANFTAAGWSLVDNTPTGETRRAYLAVKQGKALAIVWAPLDEGIALLLCDAAVIASAAVAQTPAPQSAENAEAGDGEWNASTVFLALSTIFGVIGLIFLWANSRNRKLSAASQSWPTTEARILSSAVEARTDTDSEGDSSTSYEPVVCYGYQVGGRSFEAKRIRFDTMRVSERVARIFAAKYPVNATIAIRYDPANPSVATIESVKPGVTSLVLGILLLVISAAAFAGWIAGVSF